MKTKKEVVNRLRYLNAKLGEIYKRDYKKGQSFGAYPEDKYKALDVADIDGQTDALSWVLNNDNKVFKKLPNLLNIPLIRKIQLRSEQINNEIKKEYGNKE